MNNRRVSLARSSKGAALFCVLIAFLFQSCDGDLLITTYVNDLLDLSSGNEKVIYTTATVISDNLDTPEKMAKIREILGTVTNERLVKKNYSDVYSFDVKVPLLGPGVPFEAGNENDLLYIAMMRGGDKITLSYRMNERVIERINQWTKSEFYQEFDASGFSVSLKVDNDSRNDFKFSASSVYIDNRAYPFDVEVRIGRRENKVIQLSEVLIRATNDSSEHVPFMEF